MKPMFSIITACLNARDELLATAQSLERQSLMDFEWIVIDGGSSDGTIELLKGLNLANHWISEPDDGIGDAWNKGINLSSGSQVIILNAGDIYSEFALEVFSKHISSDHITCSHVQIIGNDSEAIFYAKPHLLWRGMYVPHNWCSVPIGVYKEMGAYKKIKHSMDYEWFSRYHQKYGDRGFTVIEEFLGQYFLGGHSDKNYVNSFAENERIMLSLGINPFLAKFYKIINILKHFIRYRFFAKLRRRILWILK